MATNITTSIDLGDFKGFLEHVERKESILEQYGPSARTALHAITSMPDPGAVTGFFNRQKRPWDYFIEISARFGNSWEKAVKIQDCNGNTPIHVAVINGQWDMARIMGKHAAYGYDPKYIKNNDNLTELGLALTLYGTHGRTEELSSIFTYEKIDCLSPKDRLQLLIRLTHNLKQDIS